MIIKSVRVWNFRNHSEFLLDCNYETLVITGDNGSGKTSLIEALYLGLVGKSFKGSDTDILKRESGYYKVEIEYLDGFLVNVVCETGARRLFIVEDKKVARLPKKNKYPVILFEPDDLRIVSTSPSRRREYFNRVIAQTDENYANNLRKYEKILKQRNELLKSSDISYNDLFSWDILLAKYGVLVREARREYIELINKQITEVYRGISDNLDGVEIIYKTGVSDDESKYLEILKLGFNRDLALGHTSFGIHKDDFIFMFNNEEALGSASRGEIRSIILALKFIEAGVLVNLTGKNPVVLLDDVFSELDSMRQKCLINNFKNHQILITSVASPKGVGRVIRL